MDITSYTDFNTEIDVGLLQDVESRLRMVLKKRWPELDTAPGSVFGDLFITPASRVVALIEQSTSCILSDLNLENALNGVVCDCDFIQTFLKGLGVTSLTDVNTTGMVRIHFTKDQEYTFDQGELLLFDDSYVFGFLPGDISQITIQQTNESTSTSGKVNNKYKLSIDTVEQDSNNIYTANGFYVDLPIYGPATASLTAGALGKIDEDFGKPIGGKKLTDEYISSVELLHDIEPLQLPTTLEELINLTRTITPAASLTTRANSISYLSHRFPSLKGVSMVLNTDPEMQRTSSSDITSSIKAPVVDLYIKGPHTLECTEYFTYDTLSGGETFNIGSLQHIPLVINEIELPGGLFYSDNELICNGLRTQGTQVTFSLDEENPNQEIPTTLYIKGNEPENQKVYAITLNGSTASEYLTIKQLTEEEAQGVDSNSIISALNNTDTGAEYTINGVTNASGAAIRIVKVLTGLDRFNTDDLTYTLYSVDTHPDKGFIKITYLYDPIAEAVIKHINGPACKPAFNIIVRPFITANVKKLEITYRKTAGKFFDRQKAIDTIYQFITSLTYPTIYDDAYIGDILMSCGASGIDKIDADVTYQISGALGGYNPNQIDQSAKSLSVDKIPDIPGAMKLYYGLGVRNVNYIIPNRENIILVERSTAHV